MTPRQNGVARLRFQNILRVFRETGSRRVAADMLGVHHNTVERYVRMAEHPRTHLSLAEYLSDLEDQRMEELQALRMEVAMLKASIALAPLYGITVIPPKGGDAMQ